MLYPVFCTLHSAPCTLHPVPCTLHPTACVQCGVTRLVYTSSYNAVFTGQEIVNGDHLPYPAPDQVSLRARDCV